MLSVFLLVQVAVNAALVCGVLLLVRERRTAARLAEERESRLEALARELCALGGELTRAGRQEIPVAPPPGAAAPSSRDAQMPSITEPEETPAARIQRATALLAHGESGARVAAGTALSEGEIQILRNLRRRRPAAAESKEPERKGRSRLEPAEAGTRKRRPRPAPSTMAAGSC
jgi:hypothetical protein